MLSVTFSLLLCWMSLSWVSLCWVPLSWVSLSWIILNVIILSVIMLSVIMLSVLIVNVIMLSVVMLSVAASTQNLWMWWTRRQGSQRKRGALFDSNDVFQSLSRNREMEACPWTDTDCQSCYSSSLRQYDLETKVGCASCFQNHRGHNVWFGFITKCVSFLISTFKGLKTHSCDVCFKIIRALFIHWHDMLERLFTITL